MQDILTYVLVPSLALLVLTIIASIQYRLGFGPYV